MSEFDVPRVEEIEKRIGKQLQLLETKDIQIIQRLFLKDILTQEGSILIDMRLELHWRTWPVKDMFRIVEVNKCKESACCMPVVILWSAQPKEEDAIKLLSKTSKAQQRAELLLSEVGFTDQASEYRGSLKAKRSNAKAAKAQKAEAKAKDVKEGALKPKKTLKTKVKKPTEASIP